MVTGRSEAITIVTSVFFGVSLITVLLRCFVRLRVVRAFGWDDGLMVFSMFLNTAFTICTILGAKYGMGKPTTYFLFHPDNFKPALQCWFLGQVFYVFTCILAKISIILTLLRITVHRIHIIVLYVAMSITIAVGLLFFFFTVFQCTPVNHFWNRLDPNGKCVDTNILIDIAYVYSVGAAVTDFTIGLLPAFIIWNLRMTRRDKLAVAGILGIGCIASSAVIVRIPFVHHYGDVDFFYNTTQISIWSNIEAGLGITAGSLTTFRPLIRFFRDQSYARSYNQNAGSYPLHSSTTTPKRADPEDAQRLWPGSDTFNPHVQTVVMSNGRVTALQPQASSSEEDLYPSSRQVMGSPPFGRRLARE